MTIKARTGLLPEWYTPVSETGSTAPARFKLRPMTGPEVLDIRAYYIAETRKITGSGVSQALASCLIDWENVTDDTGATLPYSQDNISALPPQILQELVNKLVAISRLTEAERKN